MAKKTHEEDLEKKKKADDEDPGMKQALSASREKPGKRVPMYGGPQMAPGNRRVAVKRAGK